MKAVFGLLPKNIPLYGILVLAFILRTAWLNTFPAAITNDELEYIISAKSLFYTGQSIPFQPLGLFSWGG